MKKTRVIIGLVILLALLGGGYYLLIRMGILFFGDVDENYYKVRGIVVSELEGDLKWPVLASNDNINITKDKDIIILNKREMGIWKK